LIFYQQLRQFFHSL